MGAEKPGERPIGLGLREVRPLRELRLGDRGASAVVGRVGEGIVDALAGEREDRARTEPAGARRSVPDAQKSRNPGREPDVDRVRGPR